MIRPQDIPVHVSPQLSLNLLGEADIFSAANGWCFSAEDTDTKIDHMSIKLTTHRLVLFHPTNREVFNFEWFMDEIRAYEWHVRQNELFWVL